MIETDISSVWGALDFSSLIAMEDRLSRAHSKLISAEEHTEGWFRIPEVTDEKQLNELNRAARKIRSHSSALVVIGSEESCSAAQGVMEFLNGSCSGPEQPVRVFFTGNSFSTRAFNGIIEKIQNLDFSLFIVSQSEYSLETAAAVRVFRWVLNRKYGPEKSREHIFVATDLKKGKLYTMAAEEGWTAFELPQTIPDHYLSLTAAGLLPMAVAGIDIRVVLAGARQIRETLTERGMDNPVWLYAGVRCLLHENHYMAENLCSAEPDFSTFGKWWCRLTATSGGKEGKGILPVTSCYPGDLRSVGQLVQFGEKNVFETFLTFENGQNELSVEPEWKNIDDMNFLAGKSIGFLREQFTEELLESRTQAGIPVILLRCGKVGARTMGQLIYFFQFASVLSAYLLDTDPYDVPGNSLLKHDRIASLRA